MAAPIGGRPTVAVALDGAEPALVQRLLASGDMPVLRGLLDRGAWSTVESSAYLGSASVWPTFGSARQPRDHGIHYVWRWDPARMDIFHENGGSIVPWWRDLALGGRRVLTFDVPLLPLADVEGAVEVAEWGAHDRAHGYQSRPPELAAELARDPGPHPYQRDVAPPHDRPSLRYLAGVAEMSCTGVRMRGEVAARLLTRERPDVALVVFTETHRASHLLWQTAAPPAPVLAGSRREGLDEALVNVFRSVDSSLGQVLEAGPRDARIAVFSLHGMRAARGVPTVLHPLLVHLGFAAEPRGRRMSASDAARMAFAATKERAPEWARSLWRRAAPPAVLNAVAGTTALKRYDWERTKAFCLPTDQHGWIQVNLRGREAEGIVPESHYDGFCAEVCDALLAARTTDGRPIVRRVLRLSEEYGGRPPPNLPDLVVDWEDAAHDDPLRISGSDIVCRPEGRRLTGKHAYDGFLICAGMDGPGPSVPGHRLHEVISGGENGRSRT